MAARRRKPGTADALLALLARLPWWVGVLLAIGSHLLLRQVAQQPLPPAASTVPQIAELAKATVWRTLAQAGQYLLPALCLLGAAISAWRRHQRKRLLADASAAAATDATSATANPATDALHGLGWQDFERLVGEAFRRQGYQVAETGGGGADGGVDLVLSRPATQGREKTLVQCKHWRAQRVGVPVVRELYGAMAARGAAAGIVVTSGRYTDEARAFAAGRNIDLVDGPALQQLIRQAQAGAGAVRTAQPAEPPATVMAERPVPPPSTAPAAVAAPHCPLCGKAMVLRTVKRGVQAGQHFWGCGGYPGCRGTRALD